MSVALQKTEASAAEKFLCLLSEECRVQRKEGKKEERMTEEEQREIKKSQEKILEKIRTEPWHCHHARAARNAPFLTSALISSLHQHFQRQSPI